MILPKRKKNNIWEKKRAQFLPDASEEESGNEVEDEDAATQVELSAEHDHSGNPVRIPADKTSGKTTQNLTRARYPSEHSIVLGKTSQHPENTLQKTQQTLVMQNVRKFLETIAPASSENLRNCREEIEVNDYPQIVRWKLLQKENISRVMELTDTWVSVKGRYCPPRKGRVQELGAERKLYVLVEGESADKVWGAKKLLEDMLATEMQKATEKNIHC